MRVITAADLGLSAEEAEVLGSLSAERDHFPLGKNLGLLEQWVRELERSELWVREEVESARIYREWTVSSPYLAERKTETRWWWGRVPLRNAQRRYLFT